MPKFIKFVSFDANPTDWWVQTKKESDILGRIEWYGPWKRYVFAPRPDTVYEEQCLRDIAVFCEQQTRQRKGKASGAGLFG